MRILHVSDFHFGAEIPAHLDALIARISDNRADLLIASGDFTQVGSTEEFRKAQKFLLALGFPYLCVPGNHDIPRFNLTQRFLDPFQRYKTFISPDISFAFTKDNVCIAGINTARRILPHWNWAHGAVSGNQLKWLEKFYASHPSATKICVMHHPVHKAEGNPLKTVVFGAEKALRALKKMKVDLVLTGHVHHASVTTMEEEGHKTIFLSASTAISRRLRGESNGFNLITLEDDGFTIEILSYTDRGFEIKEKFIHKS